MNYRQHDEPRYISFDRDAGAGYIKLADASVAETREVHPSVLLDLDVNGGLIGIEILDRRWTDLGQHIARHLTDFGPTTKGGVDAGPKTPGRA
jgi:uncharacterized protein YuzE